MSETRAYTFASKPQAVANRKVAKGGYRQNEESHESVNIMFDKRVYRGSTYSAHAKDRIAQEQQLKEQQRRKKQQRKANQEAQNGEEQLIRDDGARPPVPGRKDIDVQTDTYLEELTDRVPETEMETQTDPFMDRPSLPLFMPSKTGVDAETQVDVDELFDFDAEVEPILEVLVGKTLEHAMMEVLEEEELAAIRKHQSEFEQERNVERAQVQRLEAEAIRRNQERERRITQEKERLEREAQVKDKVAARAFASDYLSDLHNNVFDKLMESGQFYDPLIKEVEDNFLPWLIKSVQKRTDQRQLARSLTDELIKHTLLKAKSQTQQYQSALEAKKEMLRKEELAKIEAEEAAAAAAAEAEAKAAEDENEGNEEEGGEAEIEA